MLFLVVVAALVVITSGVWVAVALISAICVRPSTPPKHDKSGQDTMD
jgi:hypothetical protein